MNKDNNFHKEFINGLHSKVSQKASKNSKSINYNLKVAKNPFSDATHCSYISTTYDKQVPKSKAQNRLSSRIRSKHINSKFIFSLMDLKSPLYQPYKNTYHCGEVILQEGHKLMSSYCKNRWCLVCNRIKTAEMILSYGEELNKIENKAFLTLSRVNVPKERLNAEISLILKDFGKIINNLDRRSKSKIKGIRKLEITYNVKTNEYHPHLHGIFSMEDATRIYNAWFDLCNKQGFKVSHKGNEVKPANDNSILEVFKYCTKLFKIDRREKDQQGRQIINFDLKPLDTIFQCLRNRRTFSSFGIKKKTLKKEIDYNNDLYEFLDFKTEIWIWNNNKCNYVDAFDNTLTEDNHSKIYNVKIR